MMLLIIRIGDGNLNYFCGHFVCFIFVKLLMFYFIVAAICDLVHNVVTIFDLR